MWASRLVPRCCSSGYTGTDRAVKARPPELTAPGLGRTLFMRPRAWASLNHRGATPDAMHRSQLVLVIGGTRGTGSLIVDLLLRNAYRVRALARNPRQATPRLGSAVHVVPGDVTRPETLPAAVKDITHLIFTAGVAAAPARERGTVPTEYVGVLNTLPAPRKAAFSPRSPYLTSIPSTSPPPI